PGWRHRRTERTSSTAPSLPPGWGSPRTAPARSGSRSTSAADGPISPTGAVPLRSAGDRHGARLVVVRVSGATGRRDDEQRRGRAVGEFGGDAAEQELARGAVTGLPDDEQIGVALGGDTEQLLDRIARRQPRLVFHARRTQRLAPLAAEQPPV